MASGEKKWSSGGQEVKRVSFAPVPPGVYKLLIKRNWEVKRSESKGSHMFRYANGYFIVVIPGKEENKKRQYHSFHLDLVPSEKDNTAMPNRGGGFVELTKATGDEANLGIIQQKSGKTGKMHDTLSAKGVVDYMNNHDGETIEAKLKIEKDQKGNDQNVIEYFIEKGSEESSEEGSEEESEEGEESEEEGEESSDEESDSEGEESDEESESEEAEDELEELPEVEEKPKSKVVQGPAKKVGKKGKKK